MPNYNEMSLIELKQAAKGRGIKLYYVKKHAELVYLLSLPELPMQLKIEKKTIRQLREEAKAKNMTGVWKYTRAELVELLYPSKQTPADENQKDHGDAKEHDDPEEHNSE